MTSTNNTPLEVGDTIRDNDCRMAGRTLRVTDVDEEYCFALHPRAFGRRKPYRIKLKYVHLDDKARKSGFSRVDPS